MPPEAHAAFVCAMEDTLAGYQRPYDAPRPLICCEAGTKQWGKDVREPLPAALGRLARIDYEDERNGPGHLGMMGEPLAGQREGLGTARRPAVDEAEAIRSLVDGRSPPAETLVRMQDTLHPHKLASRYAAFPPEEARRRLETLEGHSPPQHGRGLNMAEIALGVLRRQGLDRRMPDFPTLHGAVAAWQGDRNAEQGRGDWQCTTATARVKLKRLDPILDPVKTK